MARASEEFFNWPISFQSFPANWISIPVHTESAHLIWNRIRGQDAHRQLNCSAMKMKQNQFILRFFHPNIFSALLWRVTRGLRVGVATWNEGQLWSELLPVCWKSAPFILANEAHAFCDVWNGVWIGPDRAIEKHLYFFWFAEEMNRSDKIAVFLTVSNNGVFQNLVLSRRCRTSGQKTVVVVRRHLNQRFHWLGLDLTQQDPQLATRSERCRG